MTASLFPDLAPPQAPKSDRTRYIRQAQAAILHLAMRDGEANADHVHRLIALPEGVTPNAMGVAFNGLHRAGVIVPTRFERSTRASRHSNTFRVWQIADHKGAIAYLKALRPREITMTLFDRGGQPPPPARQPERLVDVLERMRKKGELPAKD